MRGFALPRADWLNIFAGAALLNLAYPPFHLFIPSFVCLVPAVWLIVAGESDPTPLRRHLVQGFLFGVVANAVLLYWMALALWRFHVLAVPAYVVSVLVLAAYSSLWFALVGWVRRGIGLSLLVVVPLFWTAMEWIIGHQSDARFPWLGLGTSLTGFPTVVQLADVVGARGVTWLLATANAAIAIAWLDRARRRAAIALLAGVAGGVAAATAYGMVRETVTTVRSVGDVAVLQPNTEFFRRGRDAHSATLTTLIALSEAALDEGQPRLVLWPEGAIPDAIIRDGGWAESVGDLARRSRTPLLVGGYDVGSSADDGGEYFNAAFLFDTTGSHRAQPAYRKQYLVPIIERVPFVDPRWLDIGWYGGFSAGGRAPLFEVDVGRFGVLICYESTFEDLSRAYRRRGAEFLVNITNDVWFGQTTAPYQHAAHLVMRAIENRVGIARAGNSGVSEFVDPLGRRRHTTRLGERTFFTDTLYTSDVHTVYTRLGDWVGRLALLLTLAVLAYAWWQRGREGRVAGVSRGRGA